VGLKNNLKKQSQFAPAQVDAKSFVKGDYDNKPAIGDGENKANLSLLWRSEKKRAPGTLLS
jgi:hypothetical protein